MSGLHIALVGNPNCGKTALFNRLTGSRQKVANYAGVTVERKEGHFTDAQGRAFVTGLGDGPSGMLSSPAIGGGGGGASACSRRPMDAITRAVTMAR